MTRTTSRCRCDSNDSGGYPGGVRIATILYEEAVPAIDMADGSVEPWSTGLARCISFWVEYACQMGNETPSLYGGIGEGFGVTFTVSSSHR